MKKRRAPLGILLGGAGALIAGAGLYLWVLGGPAAPVEGYRADWRLTDQNGHAVSARDFRGRFLLVYFGYTSCPDICPLTLGAMAKARADIGLLGKNFVPVFISVDPARDTPAVLARYVAAFGGGVVGLTGDASRIDALRARYGIELQRHAGPGGYTLDHTSVLLLIGPDGDFRAALPDDGDAGSLAGALRKAMA